MQCSRDILKIFITVLLYVQYDIVNSSDSITEIEISRWTNKNCSSIITLRDTEAKEGTLQYQEKYLMFKLKIIIDLNDWYSVRNE